MRYRIERAGTAGRYGLGWFVYSPSRSHAVWLPTWQEALSTTNYMISKGIGR